MNEIVSKIMDCVLVCLKLSSKLQKIIKGTRGGGSGRDKVQWKVDFMKKIQALFSMAHTARGTFCGVWGSHLVFTAKM